MTINKSKIKNEANGKVIDISQIYLVEGKHKIHILDKAPCTFSA